MNKILIKTDDSSTEYSNIPNTIIQSISDILNYSVETNSNIHKTDNSNCLKNLFVLRGLVTDSKGRVLADDVLGMSFDWNKLANKAISIRNNFDSSNTDVLDRDIGWIRFKMNDDVCTLSIDEDIDIF